MYQFSRREKSLGLIFLTVISFLLWHRTYFSVLLPQQQRLAAELIPYLEMEAALPAVKAQLTEQRNYLVAVEEELGHLQNQFPTTAGFLLNILGLLAEGKVTINQIEPEQLRHQGLYQIHSIAVEVTGDYQGVADYLLSLEEQLGIDIGTVEIQPDGEQPPQVLAKFLLHQYVMEKDEPGMPPSSVYLPYQIPDPFAADIPAVPEQEVVTDDVTPWPEAPGAVVDWTLEPYVFPVK